MEPFTIADLLEEYDRALGHTARLVDGLDDGQLRWRPRPDFSPIAWHLGHQAAVAHYLVRNLTAAEPSPDPALDDLMDSATPETERGDLPGRDRLLAYRDAVAERVRYRIGRIADGEVGAPAQLSIVATTLLTALVHHEYQHDVWVDEVRRDELGLPSLPPPVSDRLTVVDGYTVLAR